jgi:hypothetical protein
MYCSFSIPHLKICVPKYEYPTFMKSNIIVNKQLT